MDGPCGARGQDAETESAGRDSPEKDEVEDQHGIEIVEITVDAEQHIADESKDPQRNHGAHAERGKHARRCGVWFLPPITAASRSAVSDADFRLESEAHPLWAKCFGQCGRRLSRWDGCRPPA